MDGLPDPIAVIVAAALLALAAVRFLVLHHPLPAIILVIAGALLPSAVRIARVGKRRRYQQPDRC